MKCIAVLALLGAAAWADAAQACVIAPGNGCLVDPNFQEGYADYSLTPDGHTHLWLLKMDGPDKKATLSLDAPNMIFGFDLIRQNGMAQSISGPDPEWSFSSIQHGLTLYVATKMERAYNDCSLPGPEGVLCGRWGIVWGNGTGFLLDATGPMTIRISEIVGVPEPATWAMMIIGIAGVGTSLRNRKQNLGLAGSGQ